MPLPAALVTKDAAAQFFLAGAPRSVELATKEEWASLLVSLEKLAESVARLKGRISNGGSAGERSATPGATITTAEEFARAVRGAN